MNTFLKKYTDYHTNENLVSEIKELIKPSYESAGAHLYHDIELCNELYTIYNYDNTLLAFFMVGYHQIDGIDCCYLGLSTCHNAYKKNGFVSRLYLEFAKECIEKEEYLGHKIVLYFTTATPIVYRWFCKNFLNTAPDIEGYCTENDKELIYKIAKSQYPDTYPEKDVPFVLRKAAKNINYSDQERERIKEAESNLKMTVFKKYQIDETQGDRFLMITYAP